jgi:hypothetical protein
MSFVKGTTLKELNNFYECDIAFSEFKLVKE